MTRRSLALTAGARSDIARRSRVLLRERGEDFAAGWTVQLIDWLQRIASDGTIIGSAHTWSATARSFPYKKHATILAEFTDKEMRIIRGYFAGQDWMG